MKKAIHSIWQGIDRFFFQTGYTPGALAFFRISIALFALVQMVAIYPDLLNIYGEFGFVRTEISQIVLDDFLPRVNWFSQWVAPFGVDEPTSVHLLFWIHTVLAISLVLGFMSRISAALLWFVHLMFFNTASIFAYGADYFLSISLFYCVLLPVGLNYSLDQRLWKRPIRLTAGAHFSIRVLQVHMCIVYFMAGFCKTLGHQWFNGEAIWRAVMLPYFKQFEMGFLADYGGILMVLGWGVIILEIAYPVFMSWKKTRFLWLMGTMAMHVGIALFMGLYLFAAIMMILNTAAFGWPYLRSTLLRIRAFFSRKIWSTTTAVQAATS